VVIRIRKSKMDRQHNGQKKKNKRTLVVLRLKPNYQIRIMLLKLNLHKS